MRFAAGLVLCLVLPFGCDNKSSTGSPGSTSRQRPPASPRPAERPAIADLSTLNETKDGIAVHVRLFAATITKVDALRFGFKLAKVGGTAPGAAREQLDVSTLLSGLTFQLTSPKGTTVDLALPDSVKGGGAGNLDDIQLPLAIDATLLRYWDVARAWKAPASALFDAPGKYTLTIRGSVTTNQRTIGIESKPISFDVVAEATRKPLADVERTAAQAVVKREALKGPPKPIMPTVEDIEGNLWTRFQLSDQGGHYEARVVEVLLNPTGKELAYDAYDHFTCVAQGTTIATPDGDRPIEELQTGDRVTSFDVIANRRTVSVVRSVERAHADELLSFGKLRVTRSHPVFADGEFRVASEVHSGSRFLGLDGRPVAHERLSVTEPTVVYDLSVTEPHTYFAGGLLVHNKAVPVPIAGPKEPWRGWFHRRAAKR